MKIKIRNFRGISTADIDATGLTLIAGPNHSGKTSIMQAIGAALTGSPIPIPGLTKQQAGLLVHAGAAGGEVSVDNELGISTITYPAATHTSEGAPVVISDDAAGMHSYLDDPQNVRAATISVLLKSEPTEAQLAAELKKLGATEPGIARVWASISTQGWDAAHAIAKETGTRLKGQWDNETGQRYGSKKADSWVPAEWSEELRDATEESLAAVVKQENEWLEAAISHRAVGDADIARMKAEADKLPALSTEAAIIATSISALEKTKAQIAAGISKLPPATRLAALTCPHCGVSVQLVSGKLVLPVEITDAELAQRAKVIADCETSLKETSDELATQRGAYDKLRIAIGQAEKSKLELMAAKPTAAATQPVDEVRARLALAQGRLAAKQKQSKAAKIHAQIGQNQAIIDILSPDGLRMTCLRAALGEINHRMTALASIAGWKSIEIRADLSVQYGGSLYTMLSESEQYRVRAVMQIAFAEIQQSTVILMDRADVLDSTGRNGLIKLLMASGKNCIVAMTIDLMNKCPDLSKVNGRVYWVENGIAKCI